MKKILFAILLCALPLISQSKSDNLVIINNLLMNDKKLDIIGIYVIPAMGNHSILRNNKDIQWGNNYIKKPIEFGEYDRFKCYDDPLMRYDIRIDFKGKTPEGEPLQYFHEGCCLSEGGNMIHHWITSLKDGSSPWKSGDGLLQDDIKKMNKKYDN